MIKGRTVSAPSFLLAAVTTLAAAVAIDMAAEQSAGCRTEHGAGGALTTGVDRAADQGAAGCTDDQANGAVLLLATDTALAVAPGLAIIITLSGGRSRHRNGERHRGGGDCESNFTHNQVPS